MTFSNSKVVLPTISVILCLQKQAMKNMEERERHEMKFEETKRRLR